MCVFGLLYSVWCLLFDFTVVFLICVGYFVWFSFAGLGLFWLICSGFCFWFVVVCGFCGFFDLCL